MKKIKIKLILAAAFIFVSCASAKAESMDLDSFLKSALENNYELVQSRAAVEKAEGQKSEMWGNFFPNLSAGYSFNYIDRDQEINMSMPLVTPSGDIIYEEVSIEMGKKENQAADITASMPLFTFGKISGGYNIASKSLDIERSRYRASRERVVSEVKKAFYRVLLTEEIVSAAQRQVSLMEENLDMTRRLYNSGKASNLDISRVKVHLSRAESGLIEAQANFKIARESLLTLCRINSDESIELVGELEEKEFNYELENLVDKALKNREELKIARHALDINRESRKVARAQNLPRISAYGSYKWEYPDISAERWADYWVAGARVDFPFLDGLSIFGRSKKNRAAVEEAAAAEKNIREQVKLQVKINYYNLKKTQKKIKVNKDRLAQAEENLNVSNQRYARGLLSNLELNQAILDYTGSRTEAASSLYNMISAIEDIKLAVGEELE